MAQTDREALAALYHATDGPSWKNSTGWDTDADLSDWHGVRTDGQGRVVKLSLPSNNLRGPIPKELGALSKLEELRLFNNQLTGPIPPELGKLAALQRINLSDNQLTGPIPSELGALSKLELLRLANNKVTGAIPKELGSLSELKELKLYMNQLTGAIPAQLGALDKLTWLDLSTNQLSGTIPSELGKLTALSYLSLGRNQLSGSIPPELGKLTALKKLYLWNNQLSGTIPRELGNLRELQMLWLSNNHLTGPIPPELGNLRKLQKLWLYSNQLTGPIPSELGALSKLEVLRLTNNNKLTGLMPPENFVANPEAVLQWVQIRRGQTKDDDVVHSHAWRAVGVLTSLWHFSLPVLDDATDLWLLWETFGGSHGGLWWTCLCVFAIADIERAYTAFFFVVLLLSVMLNVISCGRVGLSDVGILSSLAGQDVDLSNPLYLLLDSLLWTLFGSRARSSPFMRGYGLAGDSTTQELRETGLGLHAIDVIVFYHPFRYFGEFVMSFPRGHRRGEVARRDVAHRRKISMVRAVGETLWVDPLFLALSVVTGGWDENATGLVVLSALFSVLELVTELQYYVTEAEDANPLSNAVVRDVEVGVGGSGNPGPRATELQGPISSRSMGVCS